MNPCPKCGQSRMSSPAYCPGDGSCGIVGCFGSEHLTSRCSCGYAKKSPTADTVTRTSVALVRARDDVKRLRAERAACICDFEERPPEQPWGDYLPPLHVRGPEWKDVETAGRKRMEAATAPCWAVVESDDAPMTEFGKINQYEQIGDSVGFCPSCERRNVLHAAYRAARRRVVALTSGHLAATRAHMRRKGELPPAEPRKPKPEPRPWLAAPTSAPYPQPERKEGPDDDLPF